MLASELQDDIVTALTRRGTGTRRQWKAALGPIRLHDARTHPHCNWSFTPGGTPAQNAAIERLLDDIRLRTPHVLPG